MLEFVKVSLIVPVKPLPEVFPLIDGMAALVQVNVVPGVALVAV